MFKIANRIVIVFLLIMSATLLLMIYAQSPGTQFTADALIYPAFYHDLFIFHYPVGHWPIWVIPNFFLIIIPYSILYALTGNIALPYFIIGLFELACLLILFLLISKLLFRQYYHHTIVPIVLFVTFLLTISSDHSALLHDLTVAQCHTMAVLVNLLCLYVLMRYWQHSSWKVNTLLFLLCCVGSVFDALLLATFTAPVLTAMFLCYFNGIKPDRGLPVSILTGSILGYVIIRLLKASNGTFSLGDWANFARDLHFAIRGYDAILVCLWFLSLAVIFYLSIKCLIKRKKPFSSRSVFADLQPNLLPFIIYYLLIMPICAFTAMLGFDLFIDWGASRYLTSAIVLPLYGMLCFGAVYLGKNIKQIYILALEIALSLVFLLSLCLSSNSLMLTTTWLHYYDPETACVDHYAHSFASHYGLGEYWSTLPIILTAKHPLWVNRIFTGGIIPSVDNKYWFFQAINHRDQLPYYSFIVLDRYIMGDAAEIQRNLGKPNKIVQCSLAGFNIDSQIYIYNKPRQLAELNRNFLKINQRFFAKYLNKPKAD